MRAPAEIDEFAGGVEGDHRLVGFFLNQLAFEELLGILIKLQRFVLGQQLAFVLQILGGKLVHLLFDFLQSLRV